MIADIWTETDPTTLSLEAAEVAVENALDVLLAVVQRELATAAQEEGIDRMDFGLGSTFYRGRNEVENARLDRIEDVYLRFHRGGFMAYWTRDEGWT